MRTIGLPPSTWEDLIFLVDRLKAEAAEDEANGEGVIACLMPEHLFTQAAFFCAAKSGTCQSFSARPAFRELCCVELSRSAL
eukprot:scaffold188143_cov42-Prasinocladus_malaysianus.AAC.1